MMNLPFSPTFFREIDIYQQLMEYESQKDDKRLWKCEKAILIWGASDQHQHLGTHLGWKDGERILDYCKTKGLITESEEKKAVGEFANMLQSLSLRGFGELQGMEHTKMRINRNGILAGQILTKTNSLKNTWKYAFWVWAWYIVLVSAVVLLFAQAGNEIREFIQETRSDAHIFINKTRIKHRQTVPF